MNKITKKRIRIQKLSKVRDEKSIKLTKTEDEKNHLLNKIKNVLTNGKKSDCSIDEFQIKTLLNQKALPKGKELGHLIEEYRKKLRCIQRVKSDVVRLENEIIDLQKGIL